MGALPVRKYSVDQYLAMDRVAEVPSEYYDGEIFPRESASINHSTIGQNLAVMFRRELANSPCMSYGPLRTRVSPTKYLVPDMLVICGKPQAPDAYKDTVTNPKVILEILSPSTAGYDFSDKFHLYQRLESFEEYVLVSQNRARVDVYDKTPDGRWMISPFEGLDAVVRLESLGISLPMSEIYDRVELDPAADD